MGYLREAEPCCVVGKPKWGGGKGAEQFALQRTSAVGSVATDCGGIGFLSE